MKQRIIRPILSFHWFVIAFHCNKLKGCSWSFTNADTCLLHVYKVLTKSWPNIYYMIWFRRKFKRAEYRFYGLLFLSYFDFGVADYIWIISTEKWWLIHHDFYKISYFMPQYCCPISLIILSFTAQFLFYRNDRNHLWYVWVDNFPTFLESFYRSRSPIVHGY